MLTYAPAGKPGGRCVYLEELETAHTKLPSMRRELFPSSRYVKSGVYSSVKDPGSGLGRDLGNGLS